MPAALPPARHTSEDSWLHRAVCRPDADVPVGVDIDPELFFPDGSTGLHLRQIKQAKKICNTHCPVRDECLNEALEKNYAHGVWGGLSEDERKALRSRHVTRRTGQKASA